MTSGVLTVTTRSGKTAVAAGKSYLVLAPEEDRSSEILRLVRKGLLKQIPDSVAAPAPAPAPAPVAAKPAPKKKKAKAAAPAPEPEITPEPEPAPEPEPVEEVSMDPVEAILGTSPEEEASKETSEKNVVETAPRRTTRRRKRSQ